MHMLITYVLQEGKLSIACILRFRTSRTPYPVSAVYGTRLAGSVVASTIFKFPHWGKLPIHRQTEGHHIALTVQGHTV